MRVSQIRYMDISNGEGIGVSVFTAGCPYHCKGCHNASIWDYARGEECTEGMVDEIVSLLQKPHISRLSILGGEPLVPENVSQLCELVSKARSARPDIKIWLWTGTTFEAILCLLREFEHEYLEDEGTPDKTFADLDWDALSTRALIMLLEKVDYLIDGRFVQEKKDLTLRWRGSSNQRVLDSRQSVEQKAPVLADI